MRAAMTLFVIAFAAASGAALGQETTSGLGAGTGSSASSGSTGFGIPAVPNNRLPPFPGSTVPSFGIPTTTAPSLSPTTPGLSTTTPGLSTTTPGSITSTTPGVTIELSPPISNAPGSSTQIRTCPSGLTYC